MMFRNSSSSQRNHHKQLSSSLSFSLIAASPSLLELLVPSGQTTIFKSPDNLVQLIVEKA